MVALGGCGKVAEVPQLPSNFISAYNTYGKVSLHKNTLLNYYLIKALNCQQ